MADNVAQLTDSAAAMDISTEQAWTDSSCVQFSQNFLGRKV